MAASTTKMNLNALLAKKGIDLTPELVSTWSTAQLELMDKYAGEKTIRAEVKKVHATFLESLKAYLPLTPQSRIVINVALTSRRSGAIIEVGNPEQALWPKGGEVFYSEKSMLLRQPSGDVLVAPNTIIPTTEKVKRPGVQSLNVLLCSFVKMQKGEIHSAPNFDKFARRWVIGDCPFDPNMHSLIAAKFSDIFEVDVSCSTLQDQTRTKEAMVREVDRILRAMDEPTYYYLHTYIVYEFLRPFIKKKEQWTELLRLDSEGKQAVPPSAYTHVEVKAEIAEFRDTLGYPRTYVYRGGLPAKIKICAQEGIAGALASRAMAMETRGSDKTGGSFLSAQFGYAGLATDLVRNLQRGVAMAAAVCAAGEIPDIYPGTPGNVEMIYTAMMEHFPKVDWQIILPMKEAVNVRETYKHKVRVERRPGCHYVSFMPLPISTAKGLTPKASEVEISMIMKTYSTTCSAWRPIGYDNYTIYTALYGYYPWIAPSSSPTEKDAEGPLSNSRSYVTKVHPKNPHYAYEFGHGDQFYGIVSTLNDLKLFGKKVNHSVEIVKGREIHSLKFETEFVPLVKVLKEEDWYAHVMRSNARRESYWCRAKAQYSPVANVLKVPKTGTMITRDDETGELSLVSQDYEDIIIEDDEVRQTTESSSTASTSGVSQVPMSVKVPPKTLEVEQTDEVEQEEEEIPMPRKKKRDYPEKEKTKKVKGKTVWKAKEQSKDEDDEETPRKPLKGEVDKAVTLDQLDE